MDWLIFVVLGLAVGALSGLLGVGGGIILIPALIFLFGYSQKQAQGTTLAMMIPPIGLFAALEYYRAGYVNIRAALILAVSFAVGAWMISRVIPRVPQELLRRLFAIFLLLTAGYVLFRGPGSKSGWTLGGAGALLGGGWLRRARPEKPPEVYPQI